MITMSNPRYAIYFAPSPESVLWKTGSAWLGRDAYTGEHLPNLTARAESIVSDPAHYGFHATFKPPFHVAAEKSEDELLTHCQRFSVAQSGFYIPGIQVAKLGNFVALRPTKNIDQLGQLAAVCVKEFDKFRAAPSENELANRRQIGLTPRQAEYLLQWGYPYVMEEFRFHMTLTGTLNTELQDHMLSVLKELFFDIVDQPVAVDAITLFIQPDRETPFSVLERFSFSN